MKLDDLPVSRRQRFDIDTVSDRRVEVNQDSDLLAFSKP
jgi:hypothetical protein